MIDYDKLERAELEKYKTKPAPKPRKPAVEKPKHEIDSNRRLTDKQIKSLIRKKQKNILKHSTSIGGIRIRKKAQNKKLSRKMRIRLF